MWQGHDFSNDKHLILWPCHTLRPLSGHKRPVRVSATGGPKCGSATIQGTYAGTSDRSAFNPGVFIAGFEGGSL